MIHISEWPWHYLIYTTGAALGITLYEVFASTKSFWYSLNRAYLVYLVFNLAIYYVSVVVLHLTFFSDSPPIATVFAGLLASRGIVQQLLEDVAKDIMPHLDDVRTLRKTLHGRVVEVAHMKKALSEEKRKHKLGAHLASVYSENEEMLEALARTTIKDPDERAEREKSMADTEIPEERRAEYHYFLARIVIEDNYQKAQLLYEQRKSIGKHLKRERRREKGAGQ